MTALLYSIDFVKVHVGISKMENTEISLNFDQDNITTPEEILDSGIEQLLIVRKGDTNPFIDRWSENLEKD